MQQLHSIAILVQDVHLLFVCRSFRSMSVPLYSASEDCYLEAPKDQVQCTV